MEWYGVVATWQPVAFGSGPVGQHGKAVLKVRSKEECETLRDEFEAEQRALRQAVDEGRERYGADAAVKLGIIYSVERVTVVLGP